MLPALLRNAWHLRGCLPRRTLLLWLKLGGGVADTGLVAAWANVDCRTLQKGRGALFLAPAGTVATAASSTVIPDWPRVGQQGGCWHYTILVHNNSRLLLYDRPAIITYHGTPRCDAIYTRTRICLHLNWWVLVNIASYGLTVYIWVSEWSARRDQLKIY